MLHIGEILLEIAFMFWLVMACFIAPLIWGAHYLLAPKRKVNPLYVRCSCMHLASGHNMAGCYEKACSCKLTHRKVLQFGEVDYQLHEIHLLGGFGSTKELNAAKVMQPNEVIANRSLSRSYLED